jgi:hypothetical protein
MTPQHRRLIGSTAANVVAVALMAALVAAAAKLFIG